MSDTNKCFIVMPISDPSGYDKGHFGRVYEHLIKPACEEAGLVPLRADEVKNTNFIILDILKRVVTADIVVCDLSAKNPNVLYELGIRQAFDLPVVLIKDTQTDRIFDIQGVRTVDYDESLRIDSVGRDIKMLVKSISETQEKHEHDGSSLIRLLSLPRAELQQQDNISQDTSVILTALGDISARLSILEQKTRASDVRIIRRQTIRQLALPNGEKVKYGEAIYSDIGGDLLGSLIEINKDEILIETESGDILKITSDEDIFPTLTTIPF